MTAGIAMDMINLVPMVLLFMDALTGRCINWWHFNEITIFIAILYSHYAHTPLSVICQNNLSNTSN